ncbi:MAG: hypothetical protein V2I65_07315 [Paracoccaceae bacterium]|jgi:hypothetical protein|nr:hypothetical protein [Paracoccaceae bacterium]
MAELVNQAQSGPLAETARSPEGGTGLPVFFDTPGADFARPRRGRWRLRRPHATDAPCRPT